MLVYKDRGGKQRNDEQQATEYKLLLSEPRDGKKSSQLESTKNSTHNQHIAIGATKSIESPFHVIGKPVEVRCFSCSFGKRDQPKYDEEEVKRKNSPVVVADGKPLLGEKGIDYEDDCHDSL